MIEWCYVLCGASDTNRCKGAAMGIQAVSILQWVGCGLAVIGSFLIALRGKRPDVGFWLYLISNIVWIVYGDLTHAPGLITMQVVFLLTNALGIYRWSDRCESPARSHT